MATRQVKKTVTTRTYTSGGSSVSSSSSASPSTSRGASPSRLSRLQEKDQLTTLNDRLAAYIDHIRSLESDNEKLTLQIQTFEETSRREVDNVKALYERELAAARKLVDEVAKENAKLSVNVGTYWTVIIKTINYQPTWLFSCCYVVAGSHVKGHSSNSMVTNLVQEQVPLLNAENYEQTRPAILRTLTMLRW